MVIFMTEKRFTDNGIEEVENQSFTDNLTEKTYWIDHGLDEIVELLNEFNDENEQLKEIIKISCVNEICESCRFGNYILIEDYWTPLPDLDFECLKGHPSDECCEIMDCKDYEIKDLKELLEWVKR